MPPKKKIKIKVTNPKKRVSDIKIKSFSDDSKLYYKNGVNDRISLDNWVLPSNKQFLDFTKNTFRRATVSHDRTNMKLWNASEKQYKEISAYKHQKFVSDFISENTPYRGLLLYHGLGSGKSGASIMMSEGLKYRHVVIMLPASLKDNYKHELSTFADIAFKKNYNWKFINLNDIINDSIKDKYAEEIEKKGVSKELFNKILKVHKRPEGNIKGIWMIQYNDSPPNYETLNEHEQKEISEQIKTMFDHRYTILHYNSGQYTITKLLENLVPDYKTRLFNKLFDPDKKISTLTNKNRDDILDYIYNEDNDVENPFNDKVLVIDEIHNLTSSMAGNGYNGARLYELIMRAKNLKVIFLSGTPVINSAFELALMFNMLKGITKSYSINLEKKIGIFTASELKRILETEDSIDLFRIYEDRKVIEFTRVPHGFKKKVGTDFVEPTNNYLTDDVFITSLLTTLSDKGYQRRGSISSNYYTIFPDILTRRTSNTSMLGNKGERDASQELFNNNYINTRSLEVVNQNQFKNRIFGLISFYNEISKEKLSDPDIFPSKEDASEEETSVIMSNFQFIEYAAKREIERKLEKRSAQFKSKSDVTNDMPSLFRVFSRQKGLFVFPPNIKRPMPPKKDESLKQSIISSLSMDEIDLILQSLKDIFKSQTNISTKLDSYLEELDLKEKEVAENLIQKFYIKGKSGKEYNQWLNTYQFNETDFMNIDTQESSDDIEDDYYTTCRKAIEQLTETNLTKLSAGDDDTQLNLLDLSPKYVKMLENINNTPGLVFCYSQFRSVEGIEIFGKILEANGYAVMTAGLDKSIDCDYTITPGSKVRYEYSTNVWKTYTVEEVSGKNVILNSIDDEVPITKVHKCAYALWTGTETPEQRRAILDVYTNKNNMYGQKCLIFLTTQSGAEGISLFFVRQVHIMEPYWNNVRIEQVIGRSRRIKSHILLPKDQQNVKIFNYIIKYSESQLNGTWVEDMSSSQIEFMKDGEDNGFKTNCECSVCEATKKGEDCTGTCEYTCGSQEDQIKAFRAYAVKLSSEINNADKGLTSDEILHDISMRKKRILDGFLTLMKESAIDCHFNREDNIRSDPTIEDAFKCPDNIISDTNTTYNIFDNTSIKKSKPRGRKQELQKKISIKKIIVPIIVHNSKINVLIILPPELNDINNKDLIKNLPNGLDIYDYYLYHSLYYKKKTQLNEQISIGKVINTADEPLINKSGLQKSITLNRDITIDYRRIEACIKQIGKSKSKTESGRIAWADAIKQCHEEKDTSLKHMEEKSIKWRCIVCEKDITTDICPICGINREEVLIFNAGSDIESEKSSLKLTKKADEDVSSQGTGSSSGQADEETEPEVLAQLSSSTQIEEVSGQEVEEKKPEILEHESSPSKAEVSVQESEEKKPKVLEQESSPSKLEESTEQEAKKTQSEKKSEVEHTSEKPAKSKRRKAKRVRF